MSSLAPSSPLMQPVDYNSQTYYTSQYFHALYLEGHSATPKKYRQHKHFVQMFEHVESYALYIERGDVVKLVYDKVGAKSGSPVIGSLFKSTSYNPITLINAAFQLELTHHLDDEISKRMAYTHSAKTAQESQPPRRELPTVTERLASLKQCTDALAALGVLDDRDRIEFGAYIRQIAKTDMAPLMGTDPEAPSITGPTLWTLSMRLQYLGYPPLHGPEQMSMLIKVGSAAARAYRQTYKEEPKKMWDYVKGQQRQVLAYPPERIGVLDEVIVALLGSREVPASD